MVVVAYMVVVVPHVDVSVVVVNSAQRGGILLLAISVWKSGLETGKRPEPNRTLTDQDRK